MMTTSTGFSGSSPNVETWLSVISLNTLVVAHLTAIGADRNLVAADRKLSWHSRLLSRTTLNN